MLALERGTAHPLPAPRATPLAAQEPTDRWRAIVLLALVLNLRLLYLLWAR